jgi:hypothetical protein
MMEMREYKKYYTYFIACAREMRRDLLVDAVDVLFLVGFLAGSGGRGGILCLFGRHDRREVVRVTLLHSPKSHVMS